MVSRIIFDFFESWLTRDGSLSTYEDFQQQFLLVLFFSLQIIVVLPCKEGVLIASLRASQLSKINSTSVDRKKVSCPRILSRYFFNFFEFLFFHVSRRRAKL
jgi:hypothetical protein